MRLTALAIEKRTVSYFAAFLLIVGGISSFQSLGQLEDPDFTVKTGVVTTLYPGASPAEVELEVTDRLEKAIQEMPQVDEIYSTSTAGVSPRATVWRIRNSVFRPCSRASEAPITAVITVSATVGRAPIQPPTLIRNHSSTRGTSRNSSSNTGNGDMGTTYQINGVRLD